MKRVLLPLLALLCFATFASAQLPAGSKAPALEAKDWFNQPENLDFEDLKGKVIFVEFWATW
ncbi:MAG: hypothetical protein GY747_11815 [Planctomycetes bacterium]|nr:hypothetical protein [Planctomycetota bacterium]MCP4772591.1 hypothetical protein [Planctomycetota bacterium]MCP4860901.1 hypothetical protein [Planctomycetota bacterium]